MPVAFEIISVFFLGLLLGSFSTALIYRIPRKINWGVVRSECTSCHKKLSCFQLIPILSWVLSKGQCSQCGAVVSCKYPLIEFLCAMCCVMAYVSMGLTFEFVFALLLLPFLLSLFFIDLEHMILPNQLVFIAFIIGIFRFLYFFLFDFSTDMQALLISYVGGAFVYAGVAFFIGFITTKILKKNALGMGDVKFFFVCGGWLGLSYLSSFMILSGGLGVLTSLIWRFATGKQAFPFGPALILSFYILLLYQGSV